MHGIWDPCLGDVRAFDVGQKALDGWDTDHLHTGNRNMLSLHAVQISRL